MKVPSVVRTKDDRAVVSEDLFRLALEAAPTGMVMVDGNGLIVLVNAQLERLFGYSREELVGQPVEMLVPERFREHHPTFRRGFYDKPHARAIAGNRDLYGRKKDGREVPVEIRLNPLVTPDGAFVLSSIVDITERKRAAAALEASLREKETLLNEVHHRVKNNLQVISSLLSLQAGYVKDHQLGEMLQDSQNRVHSIALVHEKLYRAGNLARINLGEYLETLTEHLQAALGDSLDRVQLVVEASDLELPLDSAVPCGLVVNELVTNALKHAFPDGRRGSVTVRAALGSGKKVTVSVADDGIGLGADVSLEHSGSMGLRLVTTLARQLAGQLVVSRNKGTLVELTFEVTR